MKCQTFYLFIYLFTYLLYVCVCVGGGFDPVTITTFLVNSANDKLVIQKMAFNVSCKLSSLGTICMKCQILFS